MQQRPRRRDTRFSVPQPAGATPFGSQAPSDKRPAAPGIRNGHVHAEAFCHLRYESDDGRQSEIVWNSRDSVTPFVLHSLTGKPMRHVDWQDDFYDPGYTPQPGDRIFVSATPDVITPFARQAVEAHCAKNGYGSAFDKEGAIAAIMLEWLQQEGAPIAVVVDEAGNRPGKGTDNA